jgi:hypothetical protein
VSAPNLAAFLNSRATNEAFRTISGSVAVSAYELESLLLPTPERLTHLTELVRTRQVRQRLKWSVRHYISFHADNGEISLLESPESRINPFK